MRTFTCALIACGTLPLAVTAATTAPDKLEHPGQVALMQDEKGWNYVHFPTSLRLYVYDKDVEGKIACVSECSYQWPPIVAPSDATPLGDWTLVQRDDGRRQWAYKGRPIYVRYHDSPGAPSGNGFDGLWHFLEP